MAEQEPTIPPETQETLAPAPQVDEIVPTSVPITSEQTDLVANAEQDFISLTETSTTTAPTQLDPAIPNGVNIQALLDQLAAENAVVPSEEHATVIVASAPANEPSTADLDASASAPTDVLPSVAAHHLHIQTSVSADHAASNQADAPKSDSPTTAQSMSAQAASETQTTLPVVIASNGTNNAQGSISSVSTSVPPGQPLTHPLPSPAFSTNTRSGDDDDGPFTAEMERDYDEFIREERVNVAEGNWEKFPDGSRLFIGNLPTEKVSKRDVFRRFRKYGKLAQISIKQAYGFVQFLDASSCGRARDSEQDRQLKGRKMHLEISRPQKSKNRDRDGRRRSRSPERARNDRHSGSNQSFRDRDVRRTRDDYRPGRSPSPARGHRSNRSLDHYDSRRRSRSKTPPRYGDHRRAPSDDLPLPFRSPQDVPEVQVLVVDDLDRQFIAYVERVFRDRALRSDVLILSPRLSEAAVIKRQIMEGVLGVVRLTRISQATGRLSLQLFDQSAGADRVKFEQYEDLDPQITAELVLRARSTHRAPLRDAYQSTSYGMPASYGLPPAAPPPSQPAPTNDMASLLAQLGSRPDLQGVLAQLQQAQAPSNASNPAAALSPDVARMLAGAVSQHPPAYGQSPQAPQQPFDLAALLGGNATANKANGSVSAQMPNPHQQNAQSAQPDMQQLMAQLANYGGPRR